MLLPEREVNQNLFRAKHVVVIKQGRMQRIFNRLVNSILPFTQSTTHNGYSPIFKGCIYIGKVEIHVPVYSDYFRDTFSGRCQRIICLGKRVQHR